MANGDVTVEEDDIAKDLDATDWADETNVDEATEADENVGIEEVDLNELECVDEEEEPEKTNEKKKEPRRTYRHVESRRSESRDRRRHRYEPYGYRSRDGDRPHSKHNDRLSSTERYSSDSSYSPSRRKMTRSRINRDRARMEEFRRRKRSERFDANAKTSASGIDLSQLEEIDCCDDEDPSNAVNEEQSLSSGAGTSQMGVDDIDFSDGDDPWAARISASSSQSLRITEEAENEENNDDIDDVFPTLSDDIDVAAVSKAINESPRPERDRRKESLELSRRRRANEAARSRLTRDREASHRHRQEMPRRQNRIQDRHKKLREIDEQRHKPDAKSVNRGYSLRKPPGCETNHRRKLSNRPSPSVSTGRLLAKESFSSPKCPEKDAHPRISPPMITPIPISRQPLLDDSGKLLPRFLIPSSTVASSPKSTREAISEKEIPIEAKKQENGSIKKPISERLEVVKMYKIERPRVTEAESEIASNVKSSRISAVQQDVPNLPPSSIRIVVDNECVSSMNHPPSKEKVARERIVFDVPKKDGVPNKILPAAASVSAPVRMRKRIRNRSKNAPQQVIIQLDVANEFGRQVHGINNSRVLTARRTRNGNLIF